MIPALIQELSDEQLLAAVGRGELAKFRALMDRHAPAVHRVVYRMLGDLNEAEDITQEAFCGFGSSREIGNPQGLEFRDGCAGSGLT